VTVAGNGQSATGDDGVRCRIEALAQRYAVADDGARALERVVRWLGWDRSNFVPATVPELPEPQLHLSANHSQAAVNMLRESFTALDLERVRCARRAADIGSGIGYPGLILAIALPRLRMTLVERDAGRSGFLRRAIEALGLDNVDVEQRRVEAWSEGIGRCDLVTSRKMGRPNTILEFVASLLAPGGAVVLFHRERTPEEAASANRAASALGLTLDRTLPVRREGRSGEPVPSEGRVLLYTNTNGGNRRR
jgi:16S rRNA (guanine(527)-N(7))-methyltransferase RsmG